MAVLKFRNSSGNFEPVNYIPSGVAALPPSGVFGDNVMWDGTTWISKDLVWSGNQAAYDAIATKDPNVLYAVADVPTLTTITLVNVVNNNVAHYQCVDQWGGLWSGPLSYRTVDPANGSLTEGQSTVSVNGFVDIINPVRDAKTYQPYLDAVTGPWQGLPATGGYIETPLVTQGTGFYFDGTGDGGPSASNPSTVGTVTANTGPWPGTTNVQATYATTGLTPYGSHSHWITGGASPPTIAPIVNVAGAGTWTSPHIGGKWSGQGASGDIYMHRLVSLPTPGGPMPSTIVFGINNENLDYDGPMYIPFDWDLTQSWILIKTSTFTDWYSPETPLTESYEAACQFGHMDCVWTP